MRICLVGIEFSDDGPRASIPEHLLFKSLSSRGYDVTTVVHGQKFVVDDFDIIHAHHPGWSAAYAAALLRRRAHLVFSSHAGRILEARSSYARQSTWDFIVSRSDLVVAASRAEERVAAVRRAQSTAVIPNPITDTYQRSQISSRPRSGSLFVGRLIAEKGVFDLLRAIQQLPKDHASLPLTVTSNNSVERKAFASAIQELGLDDVVHFAGFVPEGELRNMLTTSQMLLLPSYFESAPRVIAESHACGTPVVASAVGGVAEMLEPQRAWGFNGLIRPGDALAIAGAIQDCLRKQPTDAQRHALAEGARSRYSITAITDEHLRVYEALSLQVPSANRPAGRLGSALVRQGLEVGRAMSKRGYRLA